MTDELYHSGRKGMKWYQHIFGDEAQQRRRAKRMKKNADKVARIKEKMKLKEEKNKLSDAKKKRRAQINRMFEPDDDEAMSKSSLSLSGLLLGAALGNPAIGLIGIPALHAVSGANSAQASINLDDEIKKMSISDVSKKVNTYLAGVSDPITPEKRRR